MGIFQNVRVFSSIFFPTVNCEQCLIHSLSLVWKVHEVLRGILHSGEKCFTRPWLLSRHDTGKTSVKLVRMERKWNLPSMISLTVTFIKFRQTHQTRQTHFL